MNFVLVCLIQPNETFLSGQPAVAFRRLSDSICRNGPAVNWLEGTAMKSLAIYMLTVRFS